jgi:2-polyprenyl-3-methyl-5-hydroxy-6-metoxy-1,4-benzoquinol methylase
MIAEQALAQYPSGTNVTDYSRMAFIRWVQDDFLPREVKSVRSPQQLLKHSVDYSMVTHDAKEVPFPVNTKMLRQNPTKDQHFTDTSALPELRRFILDLEPTIIHRPDNVVLDIGCGDGRLSAELLGEQDFEAIIGIDLSTNLLGHARKNWLLLNCMHTFVIPTHID